ncbi:MAG: orotate phosphoribosyltransferase [Clostridia bacterium]|nr:orotate phosphoribosyltransferase [Clostridia bacterium]MDE6356619.1 orotate phosphoribosyltransferase [Clostridia bacterium]
MEKRAYEITSHANRMVKIKVIPGHFATRHSHVNYCVDMTDVKSVLGAAKAAAKLFSDSFVSTPVDTIISLDRMKMVGAFMAEYLSHSHVNLDQNIAVITPEITNDKLLLRDNFLQFVKNKRVLLLTASATTGKDVKSVVEGIRYYGGEAVGVATVFGGEFSCDVPVVKVFGITDLPDYASHAPTDCPLCKNGVKVDAVVNSYGYSKII